MYRYNDGTSTNGAWNGNAMARDKFGACSLNFPRQSKNESHKLPAKSEAMR